MAKKCGIPVAVLVSTADLPQLARERVQRFALIDKLRVAFTDVPLKEIEREAA